MRKYGFVLLNVGWCFPFNLLPQLLYITIHTAEPKIPFYIDLVIVLGPRPIINPLTLSPSKRRMSLEVMLTLTELSFLQTTAPAKHAPFVYSVHSSNLPFPSYVIHSQNALIASVFIGE